MRLAHVTLKVRDLDRSIDFYARAIGLEPLERTADSARLGFAATPLLHLEAAPQAAPRGDRAGLFHVAWLLASRAHLGAALLRLDELGVSLTGAADHHVSEAVYLDDPDGHGIELYADRPTAEWRSYGRLVLVNRPLDHASLLAEARARGVAPAASGAGAGLGHVHLEAVDLAASSRFAQERLGLEPMALWPNAHFLAWDGYHHHLAYNDWARRRLPLDPGTERFGLVEVGLAGAGAERLPDPNGIVFAAVGSTGKRTGSAAIN